MGGRRRSNTLYQCGKGPSTPEQCGACMRKWIKPMWALESPIQRMRALAIGQIGALIHLALCGNESESSFL